MNTDRVVSHYNLHGLGIAISSETFVSAALHARLRQLPSNGSRPFDLSFDFRRNSEREPHAIHRPAGRGRPVYETPVGQIVYFDTHDQLYIDYGDRVRVLCDLWHGHVRVSILQSEADHRWLLSHPLFTIPLVELLKRRGLYSLHAAGLSSNGRGLLLAGTSGVGKSTLSLALLRAGFGCLGDDTLFLSRGPQGIRVLAFPDEIDVTDESIGLFPELHGLLDLAKPRGWPKRQIWAEQIYGANPVWECSAAAVVFPRIAHTEKSALEPMERDEALLELLPNVLLTEARSSQAHLDALGELVRSTPCYRLETGHDFDALPRLLGDLLN